MKRKNVISRLASIVLATLACLLLALLAPVFLAHRATDEPFSGSSLMASPRDMLVVTSPIRLSDTPDLVLNRGVLYADGNVADGLPSSRFVLDNPVFTLNASGLKSAAVDFETTGPLDAAFAPLVEQLTAMGFDALAIHRGTVLITSANGTSEALTDIDVEVSGRRKGVISARGNARLRGQKIKFDGSLAQIADKAAPLRWPVKLNVKSGMLDAGLDGHVNVAEDLQISGLAEINVPSIRRVARWFALPIPIASGLNVAAFKGNFTWARRGLAIENAKISIDGNEASGALSLNVAGERPLVDGTLAFTALDLSPYLEAARSQSFVFDRLTSSWSEFDLVFPIIKQFDADLRLSAPKVTVAGLSMGRGAAAITIREGMLIADIAEIELPMGRASAQGTIDARQPVARYTMRGRVESFEAGAATAALFGSTVLSGRSTLSFDVAAAGETPVEVMRRLSGKASLSLPEGGKLAMDMKALRGIGKSPHGQGASTGWGAISKGQTPLEQVEARATLQEGVLFAEAVCAHAGVGLGATGSIDIVAGSLDLSVRVKPNVPAERPLKAADLAGGETISMRGSWQEPVMRAQESTTTEPPK